MNKKTVTLTLGGMIATTLMATTPALQASENPFELRSITPSHQLAAADDKMNEAGCSGKMKEGKCGEGKCGANKAKKMNATEGGCNGKMSEGGCNGKMTEGGCSGAVTK